MLVGTSLVAKGLDIPAVTVVGVVSSDIALNLPDERAAERTFQLLSQAVGRAGRGDRPGRAFLQTYQPEHPAIVAVATGDATAFYDAELAMRERFGSPPFGRLVKLTIGLAGSDRGRDGGGRDGGAAARAVSRSGEPGSSSSGPPRRTSPGAPTAGATTSSCAAPTRSRLLDGGLDAPWSVDVDPESLL